MKPEALSTARAGRVRIELLAIGLVAALIGAACLIVASFEEERFHTTGDAFDLRLVAVRPDAGGEIYDVEGRRSGVRTYEGTNFAAWGSNMMRRDFLLELPPGARLQPVGYQIMAGKQWVSAMNPAFTNAPSVAGSYWLETTLPDFYWYPGFFFGGQRPLEFADVTFTFHPEPRGAAQFRFNGPFAAGVTNKAQSRTQAWWQCEFVLTGEARTPAGGTNALIVFSHSHGWQSSDMFTVMDRAGRRHGALFTNNVHVNGLWRLSGSVPGLGSNQIAAVEVHQPLTKTFHHVKLRYPERPVRSGPQGR